MARAGHPAASRLAAEDTLRTDSRLRREEGRTGNRGCPAAAAAGRSPGEGIHLAAAAVAVGRTGGSGGLDWDSPGSLPTTEASELWYPRSYCTETRTTLIKSLDLTRDLTWPTCGYIFNTPSNA